MECVLLILILTAIALAIVTIIYLHSIKGDLEIIMGLQEDFDAKIDAANTALDDIATAITAEAQQIADFIAHNPGIDTSSLDGVVTRLQGVSTSVGNVFEPPTPANV